jgi:hypothetical protein
MPAGHLLKNISGDQFMKKRIFRNYQEKLEQDLQDPKLASAYLNEALLDEDPRIFVHALHNVNSSKIVRRLRALRIKARGLVFDRDEANDR